jgi:hypothetical protein
MDNFMIQVTSEGKTDFAAVDGKLSDEQALANAIEAGQNNHLGAYEGASDYIDNLWWFHWEAITGKLGNREEYFSCAC